MGIDAILVKPGECKVVLHNYDDVHLDLDFVERGIIEKIVV